MFFYSGGKILTVFSSVFRLRTQPQGVRTRGEIHLRRLCVCVRHSGSCSLWSDVTIVKTHLLCRGSTIKRESVRQERNLWSVFWLTQIKKSLMILPHIHKHIWLTIKHIKKLVSHSKMQLYKCTNTEIQISHARSLNMRAYLPDITTDVSNHQTNFYTQIICVNTKCHF